ncbi:bifunctional tRNA lysidine(34) synthetase TilS/hypoxanthine phosphoribosyltransferase HprT [Listeria welshimeri]|uniref:bifunctional tRNA lysidine(34) synthetase TilS/hypoxanthine phosphoribosyltransferase HprT n=1 Tax=Listeria welshimeri TaxID=1643 RepID=UPI001887674E|nr:bifunctional tRNA lysidine(34) synthetase TilS/hypoxanthine phosphoribosyltransferase HprT [Listeria welshimeri]MBF2422837.1 bifunctional tRNA lysidine(34) synthetase TilS/hypoxanthine phosphoribosyltransferase HprT [Listeria welshimeri]
MEDIVKRTHKYIEKHDLIRSDDKLLVAVSGGPDSFALLHFLWSSKLVPKESISVAHLNHCLREGAEKEQLVVQTFCEEHHIPFFVEAVDIKKHAETIQKGIEETARIVRYKFFEKVMTENDINKLVLAHHADDQIETILMRLVRGSSSIGWSGIQPKRKVTNGYAIRPFLPITKAEIIQYASKHDLPYEIDESNVSQEYTRNRYRTQLLPFLSKENPAVYDHFNRFSEETSEDFLFLEELANDVLKKNLIQNGKQTTLLLSSFKNEANPLQRRAIHLLLRYLYNDDTRIITVNHIYQIIQMIQSENPSSSIDLPKKLTAIRSYNELHFQFGERHAPSEFYHQLEINDRIELEDKTSIRLKLKSSVVQTNGLNGMLLDAEDITLPLIVRNRVNGDRMTMKGQVGSKKLKNIFIDAKIPRQERDNLPVITDYTGKILWVPGVKKSAYDREFSRSKKQYIIRYTRNIGGNESMHNDIQKVLISEDELQEKIRELGRELTTEYEGRNPLVVGVLKGATPFMTDLLKRVDTYLEMDFMDVSSYGNGTVSSGEVKIIKDLNASVEGRDVLVIEDIIDSGRTLSYLVDLIKYRKAKSVKLVTLLDKPAGRNVAIEADYVGFVVPNEFVVGYGLDYAERYRNLPYIGVLKPEIYSE